MNGNLHLEHHQLALADLARRASLRGIPIDLDVWQASYEVHREKRDTALLAMRQAIDAAGDEALASLDDFIQLRRKARRGLPADAPAVVTGLAPEVAAEVRLGGRGIASSAEWNPNSADHGMWFLYNFLHLTPRRMTKGGPDRDPKKQLPSHSYKAVLEYLANPLVKAYVDRAEEEAALRRFDEVRSVYDASTGRIYSTWNSLGMAGTRWTSKPINLQNWDKLLKKIAVASRGRCFVAADASAVEYRVAAYLAGIPELLHLFNQPPFDEKKAEWKKYDPRYDAHSLLAAEVFGDEFTRADMETKAALRTMVKRVTYALFYGAFPEKIYVTILEDKRVPSSFRAVLTLERIERIHAGFSARFGEWDAWAATQELQVRLHGTQVISPFGRIRPWACGNEVESTKIRNTPIQFCAGELVNLIFLRIDEELRRRQLDAHFILHGHDACFYDVAEEQAEEVAQVVNGKFDLWLERPATPGPGGAGIWPGGKVRVRIFGQAKIGRTLADVS